MPTLYLPLASQQAFGTFGGLITYQGTICRVYTVPYDPRTNAQVDTRKLFYDHTKMLKSLGLFGRAACSSWYGSRWYTELTGLSKLSGGVTNPSDELHR